MICNSIRGNELWKENRKFCIWWLIRFTFFVQNMTQKITLHLIGSRVSFELLASGVLELQWPLNQTTKKGYMSREWNEWMGQPHHEPTPLGYIKRPTIFQVHKWVKNAKNKVKMLFFHLKNVAVIIKLMSQRMTYYLILLTLRNVWMIDRFRI